jgi:DNA-binding response OmpR family regulator
MGAGYKSHSNGGRSGKLPRVLIVDDEVLLACSLSKYLINKGFDVTATSCPEIVISMLDNQRFDIVITDLRMVPVSGIDIIRHLRRSGFEGIITAMSAYSNDFEKDLQELKVDCVLEKPIDLNRLLEMITADGAVCKGFDSRCTVIPVDGA